MSCGAFYFDWFPSFSVSLANTSFDEALTLGIKTVGVSSGVSLALTVMIVCKAMVDLSDECLEGPVLGKTDYFHMGSGVSSSTEWDDVVEDQSCVVQGSVGRSLNTIVRRGVPSSTLVGCSIGEKNVWWFALNFRRSLRMYSISIFNVL
ncbi:hypothetical protein RND81_13G011600 [Saponaria officinalis]|uniref:Uncharacterized protein n=1 Tax=Saponaria officinalis TaxID=3572 RepID=A0AAW1GUX4_SAPOF